MMEFIGHGIQSDGTAKQRAVAGQRQSRIDSERHKFGTKNGQPVKTMQRYRGMRKCPRPSYGVAILLASILLEVLPVGFVKGDGMGEAPALRPQTFKRIALEGNIAAGKSTLLRLLEDEVGYVVVPEPISRWQSVSPAGEKSCGGNLLELFYNDPKRWGLTFQMYAFLSRTMAQMNPVESYLNNSDVRHSRKAIAENATSVIFFERSVLRSTLRQPCSPTPLSHHHAISSIILPDAPFLGNSHFPFLLSAPPLFFRPQL
jgi:hypothetical protein